MLARSTVTAYVAVRGTTLWFPRDTVTVPAYSATEPGVTSNESADFRAIVAPAVVEASSTTAPRATAAGSVATAATTLFPTVTMGTESEIKTELGNAPTSSVTGTTTYAGATRTVRTGIAPDAAGPVSATVAPVSVARVPSTYASATHAPLGATRGTPTARPARSAHPAATTGVSTTVSPAAVDSAVVPLTRTVNVSAPVAVPVVNGASEMTPPETDATAHGPDCAPTDHSTDSTDATDAPWTVSVAPVYCRPATSVVVAAPVGDKMDAETAVAENTGCASIVAPGHGYAATRPLTVAAPTDSLEIPAPSNTSVRGVGPTVPATDATAPTAMEPAVRTAHEESTVALVPSIATSRRSVCGSAWLAVIATLAAATVFVATNRTRVAARLTGAFTAALVHAAPTRHASSSADASTGPDSPDFAEKRRIVISHGNTSSIESPWASPTPPENARNASCTVETTRYMPAASSDPGRDTLHSADESGTGGTANVGPTGSSAHGVASPGPVDPVGPCSPRGPSGPVAPCGPVAPSNPLAPVAPPSPRWPSSLVGPARPVAPRCPVAPCGPSSPVSPVSPRGPVGPVSVRVGPSSPAGPRSPVGPR